MPGGWKICLQPFLVPFDFETSYGEFARYFCCWSVYLKVGLVPVEATCKIGSVLSGHEQLLLAQRTGSVWIWKLCLHLDLLSCPQTSLHPVFSGTGNTASAAFLEVKEYSKGVYA